MRLNNRTVPKGLLALTTETEQKEIGVAMGRDVSPLRLQYLRGSRQKGLALWNVLSPQLPRYPKNGDLNGYPTFSIAGLKQEGLV